MVLPLWFLIFAGMRLYDLDFIMDGTEVYGRLIPACTYGMVGVVMLSFFLKTETLARSWLLITWGWVVLLLGFNRFLIRRLIRWLRKRGYFVSKALVIGASEHGRVIANQLYNVSASGIKVIGFLDDFLPAGTPVLPGVEVLAPPLKLSDVVDKFDVNEIIAVPDAIAWESYQELLRYASFHANPKLNLTPGLYEIITSNVRVRPKGFIPLLEVQRQRLSGIDMVLKTILDYGLGLSALLLSLPIMVAISAALYLSRYPVLERHQVIGHRGEYFTTLKFYTGMTGQHRSFLTNETGSIPEHDNPPLLKLLFQAGLDKLPQLINVITGQMSLVGPRTVSLEERERHDRWLSHLVSVKPGITGPWILGDIKTFETEMRADVYYIRNWTIWLDLNIIWQTIKVMVFRRRPSVFQEGNVQTSQKRSDLNVEN